MFEVACVCGKKMLVRSGQAGTTIPCSCGQPVAVPSLGQLRRAALDKGQSIERPQLKHDWRLWKVGVMLFVTGHILQTVGTLLLLKPHYFEKNLAAGLSISAGYILALIGLLFVGIGKGVAIWFCFFLCFCVPLGGFLILFVPGKETDREDRVSSGES